MKFSFALLSLQSFLHLYSFVDHTAADFNGLRRLNRSRRLCDGLSNKECGTAGGCGWDKGSCVPSGPVTPGPTPAPGGPAPGPGPGPGPAPSSDCTSFTKAKDCNDNGCSWQGAGTCIGTPTAAPTTAAPTSSPTTGTPTMPPTTAAPVTASPSSTPTTGSPTTPVVATYVPGDLTVPCDGNKITLSTGMDCRRLTNLGDPVVSGSANMHGRADGAGVIPHPTDGGWYYLSNSEVYSSGGGVGVLRFDAAGNLIGYNKTLTGTSGNCGGGLTPWGTWVSCEENSSSGWCHEVDPHTGFTQRVKVTSEGGNFESFAYDYDDQDPVSWRFFTTEDSSTGALTRYTPHPSAFGTGNNYTILNTDNGSHDYLVLNEDDMTFTWSSNLADGEASATASYPNSEGIDVFDRTLYFVSKVNKELFTLDLENQTWTRSSTVSGLFNLQPDQLGRVIGDGDILYFAEDGGNDCDIHGRDASGNYFTIVTGDEYNTETTGLAFSPDAKFMYAAFQGNSNVYAFWRTDGLPFNGVVAGTKYH